MNYLDPKKKRAHKVRLLVGYGLFSVAISIATLLLVYMANGYDLDRSTGQIIQNGLIYMDTQPGNAEVYLNGVKQRGTTDARLVVPAGSYAIDMMLPGYRRWSRTLVLDGGSLRRLSYARLIPDNLTSTSATELRSDPVNASQSIDKQRMVLSFTDRPLLLGIFASNQSTNSVVDFQIPESITDNPKDGTIKVLEWADDNKSMIAEYRAGESVEYFLINLDDPALSKNLTTLFGDTELRIQFQDRKHDKFFAYKPSTQSLFTATTVDGLSAAPYLTNILDYKTYGNDWVLYVTSSGTEGLVDAKLRRGDKDVLLKQLKTSDKYLLQLSKLEGAPVIGISSPTENKATIYNDPEKYLHDNPNASIPIATTVLRVDNPIDMLISADSSVIMAYGADNFASHEFEEDRSYNFKASVTLDAGEKLNWIDGQHFVFSSNGVQMMMDFDGSNMYDLVNSIPSVGSVFTEKFDIMYSFVPGSKADDKTTATSAQIVSTSLLIESDR